MFPLDSPADQASEPVPAAGDAAAAIREAETALARQNSVAAQVDLQVVTAVLNAHSAHGEGSAALSALQREIESAVSTRTDLDTPAGAREFQRYLIDRLHEIRAVVEDAHLDDTSRASLAAALASLYATAGAPADLAAVPPPRDAAAALPPPVEAAASIVPPPPVAPDPMAAPVDLGLEPDVDPGLGFDDPMGPLPADPGPAPLPAPAAAPPAPSWGGGVSAPALPPLGGVPAAAMPPWAGPGREWPEPLAGDDPAGGDPGDDPDDPAGDDPEPAEDPEHSEAPLTGVIADAVAGTPIADAFARHGITVPPAGTPVEMPLAAAEVLRGDVGVFSDRHALALGNGKALVDNQIQAIDTVTGPGFLGWLHPTTATAPAPPAD